MGLLTFTKISMACKVDTYRGLHIHLLPVYRMAFGSMSRDTILIRHPKILIIAFKNAKRLKMNYD